MSKRLLLIANDAASANVTVAYSYFNKHRFDEVLAFGNSTAKKIFNNYIKENIQNKSLDFHHNDTIITGTSGIDSYFEMEIIKKARIYRVKKIITILDNTSNFNMRFRINNTILEEKYIPDQIWVFDKDFKSDIEYINNKIIYKENIYLNFIKDMYKNNIPEIKHNFVKKFKNNYLIILTEYIYELYGLKFGFTEYDMLENILENISNLSLDIPIFLKLHPREYSNKYNIILRKYSHLNIIKDNCNIQELIYYSKAVFGINSSIFEECNIFNIPTYSIQINSNKAIQIHTLEKSNIIYSYDKLITLINNIFNGNYK